MRAYRVPGVAAVGVAVAVMFSGPTPVAGEQSVTQLQAGLNGQRERPNRADPDGSGFARVTIDTATGEICYELTVRNIAPATASHIHRADRDAAGGVVQGLQAPTNGSSSGCVVNPAVAAAVAADPSAYYINVHNSEYPAGAVRGQLAGAAR